MSAFIFNFFINLHILITGTLPENLQYYNVPNSPLRIHAANRNHHLQPEPTRSMDTCQSQSMCAQL